MYQIKFLKPLTLARNPALPTKYKPKPSDPVYEATSTITITNDLGEQFFFGDTTLTLQVRYFQTHTPHLSHDKSRVIAQSEEKWTSGKRAIDVSVPLSMKAAPAGGYIGVLAFVDERVRTTDGMGYEDTKTESLISETLEDLDDSVFKTCAHTQMVRKDGVHFLPISSDLLEVPQALSALPVKSERIGIRSISQVLLYEELSGNIARHLWDAGVLVNATDTEELLRFMSFNGTQLGVTDRLNILELGTGIGLVAIHLSKVLTNSTVLATDLEDAEEVCVKNINLNGLTGHVSFSELDWESPTKYDSGTNWDIIVITDCTYNPLYYDALINVLRRETGPKTVVMLAHKFREPFSESEFFTKIGQYFTLQKQQWHSQGSTLIHLGLYTIK